MVTEIKREHTPKCLLRTVYRISERLEYGIIGVNDPAPAAVQAPFGGVKERGLGREGGYYGLDDYLQTKLVSIQIKSTQNI